MPAFNNMNEWQTCLKLSCSPCKCWCSDLGFCKKQIKTMSFNSIAAHDRSDVRKVFGLVAYAGTGKDTFVRSVNEGSTHFWHMYGEKALDLPPKVLRYAFADVHKHGVNEELGITMAEYEATKDVVRDDGITIRQIIDHRGAEALRENPNYLIDALKAFLDSHPDDHVMVTDVRTVGELDFLKRINATCIRLFRKEVDTPPPSMRFEHFLDKATTDHLLIGPADEEAVRVAFPQYKDSKCLGKVIFSSGLSGK